MSTSEASPSASIRPYRSRRARPCDRCRGRKQGCIIPEEGKPCTNCAIASQPCSFDVPVESRPAAVARTSQTSIPTPAPAPPDPYYVPWVPPPHIPAVQSFAGRPSSLSNLLSASLSAISGAPSQEPRHSPELPCSSLDLDASDEEETILVGTASESDALMLSMLVSDELDAKSREFSGLKIRHLSTDPENQAAFIYHISRSYIVAKPAPDRLPDMIAIVGAENIQRLIQSYLMVDGQALPTWAAEQFDGAMPRDNILAVYFLAAGILNNPDLRHLYRAAYGVSLASFRPRARLTTIQGALLDLNGRMGINPSGNFTLLGTTVALSRLMGLHRDCSAWLMPKWERDLRTRLWWGLIVYDVFTSMSFGRASGIVSDWDVPLPRRSANDTPSYDAFVSLCELAGIMNDFVLVLSPGASGDGRARLARLLTVGLDLDRWRGRLDARGFFDYPGVKPPGLCSLQLTYYGSSLHITRAAWDAVATDSPTLVANSQRACLQAAIELVEFVENLEIVDLGTGYWSSVCPFIISSCVVSLVRLTLQSDREDQSTDAVWQLAVFTLRRFISALNHASREGAWDVADLALSRALYFVPLLAKQAPEFAVVLQPLQLVTQPPQPADALSVDQLEALLNSFVNPIAPYEHFDLEMTL